MIEKEDYVNGVLKAYDDFQPKNYRREAEREISELALVDVRFPNINHIVALYPKFNHIELRIEGEGIQHVFRFDPSLVSREGVERIASVFYDNCLLLNGANKEDEKWTSEKSSRN